MVIKLSIQVAMVTYSYKYPTINRIIVTSNRSCVVIIPSWTIIPSEENYEIKFYINTYFPV